MEKTLGKEYTNSQERKAFLRDNCDCVVEKGYMKPFAPEKIVELKENLSEVSIEIAEIDEAKDAAVAEFKAQLKPRLQNKAAILRGIKERAEYVKEDCYKFVDQEDRTTGFYNSEGDLIESRPANPDELQGRLFPMNRMTGTND
jgi:hypothetical protein